MPPHRVFATNRARLEGRAVLRIARQPIDEMNVIACCLLLNALARAVVSTYQAHIAFQFALTKSNSLPVLSLEMDEGCPFTAVFDIVL